MEAKDLGVGPVDLVRMKIKIKELETMFEQLKHLAVNLGAFCDALDED